VTIRLGLVSRRIREERETPLSFHSSLADHPTRIYRVGEKVQAFSQHHQPPQTLSSLFHISSIVLYCDSSPSSATVFNMAEPIRNKKLDFSTAPYVMKYNPLSQAVRDADRV
jgi:hypothetical protein